MLFSTHFAIIAAPCLEERRNQQTRDSGRLHAEIALGKNFLLRQALEAIGLHSYAKCVRYDNTVYEFHRYDI